MGSQNISFTDCMDAPPQHQQCLSSRKQPIGTTNLPLSRQSSVYTLTLDEFQNTFTGPGMDFGSINMDELLKNICTAEEMQYHTQGLQGSIPSGPGSNLHRLGSLALPRTLSQKTVDEVRREFLQDNDGGGISSLGDMTLEDFLARAGVVREDTETHSFGMPMPLPTTTSGIFIGEYLQSNTNTSVPAVNGVNNSVPIVDRVGPSQQNFPKQHNMAFASTAPKINNGVISNCVITMSDSDTLSPNSRTFNCGGMVHGRKAGSVEKVIERRQRRMIKNRESAARSRARKQAYTMELESEISKLKEMNEELQKKQVKITEMCKNQIMETMTEQWGGKRRCLRRTSTGPW